MPRDTAASLSTKTSARDRRHAVEPRPDGAAGDGEPMFKQTGDGVNRVAGECMAIYSDNMASAVKSGALAANLANEISMAWLDALGCAGANMAEIGRETLTCRTPLDLANVQKKAIDGMVETLTAANRKYSALLASFGKAIDPLAANSADGPERMLRAFAD